MHHLVPIVTIKSDRVVTNSHDVAAYFEKRHADVVRSIRSLDCSREFNERNFASVVYTDAKGEERPMYDMTRDGFVFLAMGFTGAKAAGFKEDYINEFNRMEEELRKRSQQSIPTDYASALRLAADEHEKRLKLEAKVAEDAPKVENWEAFQNTASTITSSALAKNLGLRSPHQPDAAPALI
ncbi:Rha family transcriptional regulator [Camelimonas sp. ID_303_24]